MNIRNLLEQLCNILFSTIIIKKYSNTKAHRATAQGHSSQYFPVGRKIVFLREKEKQYRANGVSERFVAFV